MRLPRESASIHLIVKPATPRIKRIQSPRRRPRWSIGHRFSASPREAPGSVGPVELSSTDRRLPAARFAGSWMPRSSGGKIRTQPNPYPPLIVEPRTHDGATTHLLHPGRLLPDLPGLPRDPRDDRAGGPADAGGLRDLPRRAQPPSGPQARLPGRRLRRRRAGVPLGDLRRLQGQPGRDARRTWSPRSL